MTHFVCPVCSCTDVNSRGACRRCANAEAARRYHAMSPEERRVKNRRQYLARKEAIYAQTKQWAEQNPEKRREVSERSRLKKYGLTVDQYQSLVSSQDGVCAVCKEPLTGVAHIDHDHATGRIRGVLCRNCNVGLGHFKDDSNLLRAAAHYVEISQTPYIVPKYESNCCTDDARVKVCAEVRAEMKSLREAGWSFGAIGKKLGLSRSWVYLTLTAM